MTIEQTQMWHKGVIGLYLKLLHRPDMYTIKNWIEMGVHDDTSEELIEHPDMTKTELKGLYVLSEIN